MNRKIELREIVLDIIFGRESVTFDPWQFGNLTLGVAQILYRRSVPAGSISSYNQEPERHLEEDDWLIVSEIFWDLIVERVITVGLDSSNPKLPWYRLHSEAVQNLERKKTTEKGKK
jgi:hypothetical protein